eukprot:5010682-Amphidinium_carterae.1
MIPFKAPICKSGRVQIPESSRPIPLSVELAVQVNSFLIEANPPHQAREQCTLSDSAGCGKLEIGIRGIASHASHPVLRGPKVQEATCIGPASQSLEI